MDLGALVTVSVQRRRDGTAAKKGQIESSFERGV